ncbi:hypothetical protein DRJ19_02100 [Candidatus Woesearchaeota archaeon]|nr:MAG: hypothetical protein DRJ19_02100 [Candidatus Woesearchaeota archaeon]
MAVVWVCFKCLEEFDPHKAEFCDTCGWAKCPYCDACLCSLSRDEKRVAIAMYLSYTNLPDNEKQWWLEKAKVGADGKP